jgi:hypothetical protein
MPAVSKKQQQLFKIVYAYQMGKISPDKVNSKIKKIANTISPQDAKKYATGATDNVKKLHEIFNNPMYVKMTLNEIINTNTPNYVKGQLIDIFTAHMIMTVVNKLNEDNQRVFFQHTLNEMVAFSYKILTH